MNRHSRRADAHRERGASAVEFALVLPLLMLFLLGVIQYGMGLYQLQNFNSLLSNVSNYAATGVSSCGDLRGRLTTLANQSGITLDSSQPVKLSWLTPDAAGFTPGSSPTRLGLAQVTATFKPFRIGAPFVPFPQTITRTQTAPVQDLGQYLGVCG